MRRYGPGYEQMTERDADRNAGPEAETIAIRPEYDGGSIVNLMASIVAASGGTPRYAPLDGLDADRLAAARHIVLVVVDGLGYEFLSASEPGRVLRDHLRQRITTVYPPTTATAITTFLTGLAPQQHGLTGWYMHFAEIGSVVSVLPFATRLGAMPLATAGVTPERLLGHTPIFELISRAGIAISPRRIARSDFNRAHTRGADVRAYESLDEFVTAIAGAVRGARRPSYVYAYWPDLDQLAHTRGIASPAVRDHLRALDAAFEELLGRLAGTDTLVLLTADHGFVDVDPAAVVYVRDHAPLHESLQVPLCGEPRTAYCYVSPRHADRFTEHVAAELAAQAVCVESARLVDEGYFGPGPPHARLLDRLGSHTLLMRDGCAILDTLPGEPRRAPLGMHGGGSTAELNVPLVVAET